MSTPSKDTLQATAIWQQIQQVYPHLHPSPEHITLIEAVEAFYKDHHPDLLIVETDPQGVITYVNEAFAQAGGYSVSELLGQNINILRSDHNPPGYFRDLWNTITQGLPWRGFVKNRTRDYELYQIELLIIPIPGADGKVYRYLGLAYDASYRLESEQALEQIRTDLHESLRYSRRIQRAIFPTKSNSLQKYFPESFLISNPRDVVSGDFCWMARTAMSSRTILAVADCTGHGVPGALLTLIGYNLLSQIVLYRSILVPHQILAELHKGLREYFVQDDTEEGKSFVKDGMEIVVCSFDYAMSEVQFAGANRPLWLVRKGELIEYKTDKKSIGGEHLLEDVEFQLHTLELEPEDRLYFFTDGIVDQFGGPQDKRFGTARLKEAILKIWGEPSMNRQRALFNNIWKREWMGDNPPTDDATLVGIRILE
ncbi:MAG: SpoIIE family protein phosphatase [Bacteroidia bacterium]|nr:SpoIIE family protein phosphatase [Bacteroidia bacterium]MDW8236254.1 SpoIIE family protein phosphatase [Bacteroidia bacterium]